VLLWNEREERGEGRLMENAERDSAKDQAVVFIFIFATVGLLSYAAVRPWIEQWAAVRGTLGTC
jgi:ABC-type nitrate/sulfonate/bicarbonate transport system permease component